MTVPLLPTFKLEVVALTKSAPAKWLVVEANIPLSAQIGEVVAAVVAPKSER